MSAKTFLWISAALALVLAPQVFLPVVIMLFVVTGVGLVGLAGAALLFPPRKHL